MVIKLIEEEEQEWEYESECTADYFMEHREDFPLDTIIRFRDPGNVEIWTPKYNKIICSNGYMNKHEGCARCKLLKNRRKNGK